ncbi:MAG: hypothetical protein QM763_20475 [Agriterribacter sp.]
MKALSKAGNFLHAGSLRSQWIAGAIILFLPFAAVYIYTSGLTKGLNPVFSVDEPRYHYPTILNFAKQLPFPDIRDYDSATTPLFHILLAALSKVIGTDVHHLRLVNFFITYFSVVFLFFILIRRFKATPRVSLLYAMIFALSPYYFREAFVILTDNLPLLWLLCFFNYYFRYKAERKQHLLLLSLFFVMLLCLTRQTFLFVCLVVGIDTLLEKTTIQHKFKVFFLVLFAAIPTLSLFVLWKGLTPPGFREAHTRDSLIDTKATLYGLSTLGFYSLFMPGVSLFTSVFQKRKLLVIAAVLCMWVVLLFFPLIKDVKDFGYLWYMAAPAPCIAGTSLLFWGLLPLGAISLLSIWNKEGFSLLLLFLLCLFLSEVPNKFIFQRYYDGSIILTLIFFAIRYHESNKIDFYRRIVLIAFFIIYFVVFTVA